jgi:apolipoprotein N-acyltransferase
MRTDAAPRLVAFGCAVFRLLAIVAPRELARKSWERDGSITNDTPAGYVGAVSLCGIVALGALALGSRWRRARVAGAILAAVAFAFGVYVAGSYWVNLARGVVGLEGSMDATMRPPEYTVHFPLMLPIFLFVASAGLVGALTLAVQLLDAQRGGATALTA